MSDDVRTRLAYVASQSAPHSDMCRAAVAEIDRLRQRVADLERDSLQTCPHVRTSAEGTSYCTLAELGVRRVPEEIRALPKELRIEAQRAVDHGCRDEAAGWSKAAVWLDHAIARHEGTDGDQA